MKEIRQGQVWKRTKPPGVGDRHVVTLVTEEDISTWGQTRTDDGIGGFTFLGDRDQFLAEFSFVSEK